MTDVSTTPSPLGGQPTASGRVIDERFLKSAQLPFGISLAAIVAIILVAVLQGVFGFSLTGSGLAEDSAFIRFLFPNALFIALFLIATIGAYIGYRLVVAAGAKERPSRSTNMSA